MVAVGGALLITAGFASPSGAATAKQAKTGGTLNFDYNTDFQFMDPQIAYYQLDWTVLQSTCVKLLNWPDINGPKDAQLQPEAATRRNCPGVLVSKSACCRKVGRMVPASGGSGLVRFRPAPSKSFLTRSATDARC